MTPLAQVREALEASANELESVPHPFNPEGRFAVARRCRAALSLLPSLTEGARDPGVAAFLSEVGEEITRARAKFPGDVVRTLAFSEEAGELVKAVLDEPAAQVRKEAVQAAAMAARIVLDGDGSVKEWRASKGLDALPPTDTEQEKTHA